MTRMAESFLSKYWPIIFGTVTTIALVGVYAFNFGTRLSTNQNIWADFGNYLGGVAGPLLSLLTIVLVLQTLTLQREELMLSREELRKSSEALERQAQQFAIKDQKDDLFDRAQIVYDEVTKARGAQLNGIYTERTAEQALAMGGGHTGQLRFSGVSLDDILKTWSKAARDEIFDGNDERAREVHKALSPLVLLLGELAGYLHQIDALSTSHAATDYFRRRIGRTVTFLASKHYLSDDIARSLLV